MDADTNHMFAAPYVDTGMIMKSLLFRRHRETINQVSVKSSSRLLKITWYSREISFSCFSIEEMKQWKSIRDTRHIQILLCIHALGIIVSWPFLQREKTQKPVASSWWQGRFHEPSKRERQNWWWLFSSNTHSYQTRSLLCADVTTLQGWGDCRGS